MGKEGERVINGKDGVKMIIERMGKRRLEEMRKGQWTGGKG